MKNKNAVPSDGHSYEGKNPSYNNIGDIGSPNKRRQTREYAN
jgi:hypothetical protein